MSDSTSRLALLWKTKRSPYRSLSPSRSNAGGSAGSMPCTTPSCSAAQSSSCSVVSPREIPTSTNTRGRIASNRGPTSVDHSSNTSASVSTVTAGIYLDVTPTADTDLQSLYRQPPERFIAARTALANRLRDDGNVAEAERIAKLRRPTLAASAINQAVAKWPGKASGLVAAGRQLRRVHDNALKNPGDPGVLRAAASQERSAV